MKPLFGIKTSYGNSHVGIDERIQYNWLLTKQRWSWVNLFFPTRYLKLAHAADIIGLMTNGFVIEKVPGKGGPDLLIEVRSKRAILLDYPYTRKHLLPIDYAKGWTKSQDAIFIQTSFFNSSVR